MITMSIGGIWRRISVCTEAICTGRDQFVIS